MALAIAPALSAQVSRGGESPDPDEVTSRPIPEAPNGSGSDPFSIPPPDISILAVNPFPGVGDSRLLGIQPSPFIVQTRGLAGGIRGLSGLDFQPSTGILFASTGFSDGGRLFTIDTLTGAASLVGATGFDAVPGLTFDLDGTLYGSAAVAVPGGTVSDRLIRIDPNTGVGVEVGLFGTDFFGRIGGLDGIAVNPTSGTLYGVSGGFYAGGEGVIFTIDKSTGAATSVGQILNEGNSTGTTVAGLAFDTAGNLFGSFGTRDGRIIQIDLAHLKFRFLGDAAIGSSVSDIAVVPPPPPPPPPPPVADAGDDQVALTGDTVLLDGSLSTDGGTLLFAWTFTSVPADSAASLVNADTVAPSFVPDLPGVYAVELVVTNSAGLASAPDEVLVSAAVPNAEPTADAGSDATIPTNTSIQLDGTASSDPDGDPLTFAWTILSAPGGSAVTLVDDSTATPTLTPDLSGTYALELVVNDGTVDSDPATVEVTAIDANVFLENKLQELDAFIAALPPEAFEGRDRKGKHRAKHGKKSQKKFRRDLKHVIRRAQKLSKAIDRGDAKKIAKEQNHILRDLARRLLARTDGVALRGTPDVKHHGRGSRKFKRDRIIDSAASLAAFDCINIAIGAVEAVQ